MQCGIRGGLARIIVRFTAPHGVFAQTGIIPETLVPRIRVKFDITEIIVRFINPIQLEDIMGDGVGDIEDAKNTSIRRI